MSDVQYYSYVVELSSLQNVINITILLENIRKMIISNVSFEIFEEKNMILAKILKKLFQKIHIILD